MLNKIPVIRGIVEWVVEFIYEYIAPWIIDRGGWVGDSSTLWDESILNKTLGRVIG